MILCPGYEKSTYLLKGGPFFLLVKLFSAYLEGKSIYFNGIQIGKLATGKALISNIQEILLSRISPSSRLTSIQFSQKTWYYIKCHYNETLLILFLAKKKRRALRIKIKHNIVCSTIFYRKSWVESFIPSVLIFFWPGKA